MQREGYPLWFVSGRQKINEISPGRVGVTVDTLRGPICCPKRLGMGHDLDLLTRDVTGNRRCPIQRQDEIFLRVYVPLVRSSSSGIKTEFESQFCHFLILWPPVTHEDIQRAAVKIRLGNRAQNLWRYTINVSDCYPYSPVLKYLSYSLLLCTVTQRSLPPRKGMSVDIQGKIRDLHFYYFTCWGEWISRSLGDFLGSENQVIYMGVPVYYGDTGLPANPQILDRKYDPVFDSLGFKGLRLIWW